jgi:hypothetical protein
VGGRDGNFDTGGPTYGSLIGTLRSYPEACVLARRRLGESGYMSRRYFWFGKERSCCTWDSRTPISRPRLARKILAECGRGIWIRCLTRSRVWRWSFRQERRRSYIWGSMRFLLRRVPWSGLAKGQSPRIQWLAKS